MKRSVIPFDGGMNEVAASSSLKINIPNNIINYENKDSGKITKRVDPDEFDSNLNSAIDALFTDVQFIPDEPYYPSRTLSDMYSDVMYPVYGVASGDYKLYLIYADSATTYNSVEID